MTEELIAVDLNLPDHSGELGRAEELMYKIRDKINSNPLNNKTHPQYYEEIVRVLDYVGNLSIPCFNIEDQLEALYVLRYKHSPALGKKLLLDHYGKLHRPYNILKNRCFRMLEELDTNYIRLYKTNPPNYNI